MCWVGLTVCRCSAEGEAAYRGWTAGPARTWVSRRWSRTLFSERRRGPAGGQTWSSVDLVVVGFFWFILVSLRCSFCPGSCRRSLACLPALLSCSADALRTLGRFRKFRWFSFGESGLFLCRFTSLCFQIWWMFVIDAWSVVIQAGWRFLSPDESCSHCAHVNKSEQTQFERKARWGSVSLLWFWV